MRKEYTFAVLWIVVTLVMLSFFPEKKTRYLLPLLIPAAMVVAHYIVYIFMAAKEKTLTAGDRIVFRVNAFIPALIALGMPVAIFLLLFLQDGHVTDEFRGIAFFICFRTIIIVVDIY